MPIIMIAAAERRRPAGSPVAIDDVWMLDQVLHDQFLFSWSFQRRLESMGRRGFTEGEGPGTVPASFDAEWVLVRGPA